MNIYLPIGKSSTNQWRTQDFSYGGVDLIRGGADSLGSYISKILYVETKESGPLGGVPGARPLDPPMVLATHHLSFYSCNANLQH